MICPAGVAEVESRHAGLESAGYAGLAVAVLASVVVAVDKRVRRRT